MPRAANLLQVRFIETAKPKAADYYLNDGARLAVRVYPSGLKRFCYRFEAAGRMRRIEHDKPFGKGPGALSLTEARAWRNELDGLRRQGIDPVSRTLAQREQSRRLVELAARPRKGAPDAEPVAYAAGTFGAIADEFYRRVIERTYRQPLAVRRILDADLLPELGPRPVAALRLGDVQTVLNRIVDRGAPVSANRALLVAKRVMRYARMQGHAEANPIAELTRRDVGGTEGERERALAFEEIPVLWRALAGNGDGIKRAVREFKRKDGRAIAGYARAGLHLHWQARACLQLLLLTGQRIGETLAARWGEFDLAAGLWRIPPENTKGNRPHLVHLPALAVELLRALPGSKGAEAFVFAAEGTERPAPIERRVVTRALDRLLATGALPLAHFTPHDLRRTVRSRLSDLGVLPHVAEKILAHRLGGVLQVYDRAEYLPERAAAMAAWDRKLRELLA
jgi:integrase